MKKTIAEFHHKKAGDSSGEFFRKINDEGCFAVLKVFSWEYRFGTNIEYNSGVTRYRVA